MSEPLTPVDANDASLVRVSRDGGQAILQMASGDYHIYSVSGDLVAEASDLKSLLAGGSWRVPVDDERDTLVASLFSPDIVEETEAPRAFRVPAQVRTAIADKLDELAGRLSETDLAKAQALASGSPVGIDEVAWISSYFESNDDMDQIRGGYKGRKWAEKIVSGDEYDPYAKYCFDGDDECDYVALGPDEDSPMVDKLLQINWETGDVLEWTSEGFEPLDDVDINSFEYPLILPIDIESAQVLARWLDENPYDTYDIRDTDPEARNLFETAYDELDFEEIDRFSVVIADASGYTPAERSLNARRQVRGFHGRFGGRQVKQTSKLKAYKKSHLSGAPVIDPEPGKTIKSWLAEQAPVTAAAKPKQGRSQSVAQPDKDPVGHSQVSEDKTSQYTGETAADKQASTESDDSADLKDAIYFAVVDVNDATAVLDVVAITRNSDGQPEAWRRLKGEWKADPDTLAKLMGSTPPPVVKLEGPELVKAVLAQVDAHDAKPGDMPTDAISDEEPPAINASAHLEVDDVEDLKAFATQFSDEEPDDQTKIYLRRRAKALNRLDVIPEPWRVATPAERGMELASTSPLFGEYGQVLTAAGHPFDGAKGAERLKEYWTHGAGAAKIRWGTPGDLTRAHRHLAKFVGPDRAWGLSERYAEHVLGMSNRKYDKLTGQTHSKR